MNFNLEIITAISIGLFSSGHCLGMCGPIIMILSTKSRNYKYKILYNTGRILSYIFMVIILHFLGYSFFNFSTLYVKLIIKIIGNTSIILIGLYISNILNLIHYLEKITFKLWIFISSIVNKINKEKFINSILLGFIWGYIPCGLTYNMLIWSISFESLNKSIALMFFFGIGTLPSMLFTSYLSSQNIFLNIRIKFKLIIGMIIVIFGIKNIIHILIYNDCH